MTDQKRLTIIEILIVLAVIGLISTLSAVAVASARANARDAVRLSNVRQIQSALEDFFVVRNNYPIVETAAALGFGSFGCLTAEGFLNSCTSGTGEIILKTVPVAFEIGLNRLSSCAGAANAFCYLANGDTYAIQFELEHAIASTNLQHGLNCATPDGMKAGACK